MSSQAKLVLVLNINQFWFNKDYANLKILEHFLENINFKYIKAKNKRRCV